MAKVALLIGVSEYEPELTPLPAAVKDVAALERILQNSEIGGFDEVKVLTNPDPQAMQYDIETLFTGRSREDLVLLFFSGHGIKDDSNNLYFATRITQKNSRGNLIRSTAVPARFIHEVMNNSRAKRQTIILDCCFSGAFDPALRSKDDGSVDLQGQLGAEGRVVLTSSSSTQYSFEQTGSELSLYTRYLVEGIETGAGDLDEDGKISILELHDYATEKVRETAPNMTPKLITLKDMGFEIVLAKAKITDPKLRYRRQVERYNSQGHISSIGRTILDTLQAQLSLAPDVARQIETDVLRPHQERLQNLQLYRQKFAEVVEHNYPLKDQVRSELNDLLQILGLREEDVESIEQQIISQITQNLKNEPASNQQNTQPNKEALRKETAETRQNQKIDQPDQPNHTVSDRNLVSNVSKNMEPLNKKATVSQNKLKVPFVIAACGLLALLGGSLLIKSLPSSNSANMIDHGEQIESNTPFQSASNQEIDNTPFEPVNEQEISVLDHVIQNPNSPIPSYFLDYKREFLSPLDLDELNTIFNQFDWVESTFAPVEPGSATTYEGWNALCIGEERTGDCPKSAEHELNSYGNVDSDMQLLISRGWILYRPES